MAESVKCEIVEVTCCCEDGTVVQLEIPAYTVSPASLRSSINSKLAFYLQRSKATCNSVSLGDFALYLLEAASHDPREQ